MDTAETTMSNLRVVLIHDGRQAATQLARALGDIFRVNSYPLGHPAISGKQKDTVTIINVAGLTGRQSSLPGSGRCSGALFLLNDFAREERELARELGAAAVLPESSPLDQINHAIIKTASADYERGWEKLGAEEHKALRSSVESFGGLMLAGRNGEPLPMEQIHSACEDIKNALDVSDVDRWLSALSGHHDGTYRHCMYVCGTLAFFGNEIGVRGSDLSDLTTGGFLHDVGKSMIPLAILDKPGKLDPEEWKTMQGHPEHSREIMLREHDLDERIIKMAVHHHEKLDGTGYPDGLAGAQIDDLTRLTAIADVYAALTEERAYKASMPAEKAFDLMATFEGHLDQDLIRRFREFMLDSRRGAQSGMAMSA